MRPFFLLGVFLCWAPLEAGQAPKPLPILLDTDIGDDIDDAFAVALALASPELDVRGVTTVHGDAHTRALIVCRWLHALGSKDVAVAPGTKARGEPTLDGQFQYGLRPCFRQRPVRELAPQFLYQQLKARPGELTLVAVGPLTNIAELLRTYPECKPWIKRLILMGGSVRVGYDGKATPEPEWNIKSDVKAAQFVFEAGIPMTVAPLDATARLKLNREARSRVLRAGAALNQELFALYQLWDGADPILFDPVAITLGFTERFCKMEELHLTVDDKGSTRVGAGKANARVATSIDEDAFLKWYVERLTAGAGQGTPHKIPLTNLAKPVPRGNFPNRVHVLEDYETDIERRWWLCGKLETKNIPPGSKRTCRGVWTNDFDDRMGDPKAQYTAVIFNPVPGPPMGPRTRLGFRCRLKGTGNLRVQLYSLSKGYHRHLTLTGLPQETWQDLTVDMTQMRRPDGSGGPLAQDERIDDIQFYTDSDAELLIDDLVLYDAAADGEERAFPKRLLYTAWFDTGKQGAEWPGTFDIVAKPAPHSWKAARSVTRSEGAWIRLDLRGGRPSHQDMHLRFRYHLTGAESIQVALVDENKQHLRSPKLKPKEWAESTLDFSGLNGRTLREIQFLLPRGAELLVDDVLLFAR